METPATQNSSEEASAGEGSKASSESALEVVDEINNVTGLTSDVTIAPSHTQFPL